MCSTPSAAFVTPALGPLPALSAVGARVRSCKTLFVLLSAVPIIVCFLAIFTRGTDDLQWFTARDTEPGFERHFSVNLLYICHFAPEWEGVLILAVTPARHV